MSKVWDFYGRQDPFYGVLSAPEFSASLINDAARQRFFESGQRDVNEYIRIASSAFGPLAFSTALDYGCGVGRLSLALSEHFARVISVDISEGMLATARGTLAGRPVQFENAASMTDYPADFLLSLMVFQHIPPSEGMRVLPRLAGRLRGTGIVEIPIRDKASLGWRALRLARRAFKAAVPVGRPIIPMFVYDERALIGALEASACRVHVEHVDTPMYIQARLIFHR